MNWGFEGPWIFSKEEHERRLQELDEEYPDYLEFACRGGVFLQDDKETLEVKVLNLEVHRGHDSDEVRIRLKRSGDTLASIEDDIAVVDSFADVLSYVTLGKGVEIFPGSGYSAKMSISHGLREEDMRDVENVIQALDKLDTDFRVLLDRALAWYRDSSLAKSLFNQYTMLWNSLEILVMKYSREEKPSRAERLENAKGFVSGKGSDISLQDFNILCQEIVQESIRSRMMRGFRALFDNEAESPIGLCFNRVPEEIRLWQVRNDINHGNILERTPSHRTRVLAAIRHLNTVAWNSIAASVSLQKRLNWSE